MKRRALLLTTYEKQAMMAREMADAMDFPLDIFRGGFMSGGHLFAYENRDKYDAFIAFSGGGAHLRKLMGKPVVSPPIPFRNLLDTFLQATSFGNPVTLLSYKDSAAIDLTTVAKLSPVLNCNFALYTSLDNLEENIEIISKLKNHTVIVAGECVEQRILPAKTQGLRFVLLETPRQTLGDALMEARSIIALGRDERLKAERINGIMEHAIEGVIIIDKDSTIKAANARAGLFAGISSSSMLDKNILDKSLPPVLQMLYGDGTSVAGQNIESDGERFIINRINILHDEECNESIITFHRVKSISADTPLRLHPWGERGFVARRTFEEIVSTSENMAITVQRAKRFSQTEIPIIVEGETGTGKEVFVQSIHNASARKNGPFVVVNCAALPESLLESELFGHEEGSFTGARRGGKKGLFEIANNGTIFLDEISESSLNIQSRLLRVLQEKEVMRVGGTRVLRINARIIAATNKNLFSQVQTGAFRNDLYFRLCRLRLVIPPLRERKEDIYPLFLHFLKQSTHSAAHKIINIAQAVAVLMQHYAWPGNVRELESFIESLTVLYDPEADVLNLVAELLNDNHLGASLYDGGIEKDTVVIPVGNMKEMQREILLQLFLRAKGNRTVVAEQLQISRVTIWKMLKENQTALAKKSS